MFRIIYGLAYVAILLFNWKVWIFMSSDCIIIIIKFFTVGIIHSYKKTNSNQLFAILKI